MTKSRDKAETAVGAAGEAHNNRALRAEGLWKQYRKRPVLSGVSVRVEPGEVVGLLGANGAGKTTCFYIITGLLHPDKGSVFIDGQDATHLSMHHRARHGLGYLPQEASIFRGLDVGQNVRAVLQMRPLSREQREDRLEQLLQEFSIAHLRSTPATALSGGERRRLEIARTLAGEPRYILLDEPFAGIDPIAMADMRALIGQLKGKGIGVLITDHNVRETLGIVDRAYILNDGLILHEGVAETIVSHADVRKVYLGDKFEI
jgi:lipopolysaccharide export system ATP-binding protein